MSEASGQILTVQGDPETIARAVEHLIQLDLRIRYVDPDRTEQLGQLLLPVDTLGYYRFDQIDSPDQWLGREHILTFHRDHAPDVDKKAPSQVFSALVAPAIRPKKGGHGGNARPINPDHVTQSTRLVVSTRKHEGFPPLSPLFYNTSTPSETIKRVVKVGSLFGFYALLQEDPKLAHRLHGLHNPDSTKRKFLDHLVKQLSVQMQEPIKE